MRTKLLMALTLIFTVGLPPATQAEEKIDVEKRKPGTSTEAGQESPFSIAAEIGIGYDSNAYLTPSKSYLDYAQDSVPITPGIQPTPVDPIRHSGFFIPAYLKAKYSPNLDGQNRFVASYRFDGDIYPSSTLDNANTYSHKLSAGMEFVLGSKGKREDTFYVGPFLGYHRETYFDRDSGVEKTTTASSTNISNRYNYSGIGLEAEYAMRTTPVQYGIHGMVEQRDYSDPVVVAQYDHLYYVLGGEVEFHVAQPTKLKLSYDYKVRDYDERHARDANGVYSNANPLLTYTYHDVGATLRNRLGKWLVVYLDYDRLMRNDENVGYNDYTEDAYRIRIITSEDRGNKLRATFSYWKRDYPNAFAYDNASQPRKEYDGIEATLKGELGLTKNWGLWAEYLYGNQNSTDLRYDYDRYQVMAGVKWEM